MSPSLGEATSFGRAVAREVSEENVTFMAGSIAYQAFVSLIPLLALLFLAVAVVGDQSLANEITGYTQSYLPPSAQTLLDGYIAGEAGSSAGGAGVIGAVTLLWGTLKIFRGLDTAFSEIYDTVADNSFLDQLVDGLVVLLTIGGAVLGAVVATTAFAALPEVSFIGLLNPLVLVVGLTVVFYPMYFRFPDVDLSFREVLPGVVVAAVGWALLQALFQVYIGYAGGGSTSGSDVIGAILLLLTWLYFSGLVLLLGAVVNAVIAGRTSGSGGATPEGSEAIHGKARALRRERERLDRRHAEITRERSETNVGARADRSGREDAEAVRRQNRLLLDRLRWYEKPVWKRGLLRALGYRPR
ncbi:YihY/virulence factor BrkB family protein [Halalkalicoccus jeotgali]|uniref:Ribonuclease BN n=1 Tax=Halalkalicoccus jeotgali (strain DSM 18796 / CECT 7217 / JCM 14584 / KCTC 4019 / B3) TaxID=795797 RepID=D8J9S6_HALJB|nr:YihY/virulence factor BrkB family protein [Halalkalicoccus jeotgali]ADJ16415.1 ribonuclease BN [Halalkalicoccus jeotgali B3]ELY37149.1 ribonuclease BN [Halalkalicoccus jeotgali B3]